MTAGDYRDKVVFLSGAGGGIGRAAAHAFAAAGARLLLTDLEPEPLEELAAALRDGPEVLTVPGDVTVEESMEAVVAVGVEHFGRVDVAINSAGVLQRQAKVGDIPVADLDRCYAVNLRGLFLCLQQELRQMRRQDKGGVILNLSSAAGILGSPGMGGYGASKHGVTGLTRTAAVEYARYGIRVNALCPGYVESPMFERFQGSSPVDVERLRRVNPMGRLCRVEEVVDAMLWLCSERNSYMNGQAISLDGGLSAI